MLNDVTFGQYYPVKSFIHSLDPRTKLLALIAYIVMIFAAANFYSLALCGVFLAVVIIASRVPFGSIMRSVKGVLFILIFSSALNLFWHGGETLIAEWGIIKIYTEAITFSVFLAFRLIFLIMFSALLTLTTPPVDIAYALECLLKPLTYIKVPVSVLARIMAIALSVIPSLIDETNRIINAQKARGSDFESGNIFSRVKAVVPILIPLLISSLSRAEELGDAMEARCYSASENKTKYKKLNFGVRDLVCALCCAVLIAGVILFNIYGVQIIPQIYDFIKVN